MPVDTSAIQGSRAFAQLLEKLSNGEALGNISGAMHELLADLREKWDERGDELKATLNLKITFAIDKQGVVTTLCDIGKKFAPESRPAAAFWLDQSGNLTTSNPRQPELPHVRDVSHKPETRDVDRSSQQAEGETT